MMKKRISKLEKFKRLLKEEKFWKEVLLNMGSPEIDQKLLNIFNDVCVGNYTPATLGFENLNNVNGFWYEFRLQICEYLQKQFSLKTIIGMVQQNCTDTQIMCCAEPAKREYILWFLQLKITDILNKLVDYE